MKEVSGVILLLKAITSSVMIREIQNNKAHILLKNGKLILNADAIMTELFVRIRNLAFALIFPEPLCLTKC